MLTQTKPKRCTWWSLYWVYVTKNRRLNAVRVSQQLRGGMNISQWIIKRRMQERNKKTFNWSKTQPSSPSSTRSPGDNLNWIFQQQESVLFSDETRICFHGSNQRKIIDQGPKDLFTEYCIENPIGYGGGSCMNWIVAVRRKV